ncbi:MAG TPA: hypothetical protein DCY26_12285 [Hyphomonas sp.]|nr:hypothetical protein [Hyphomonas sp.]
MSRTTVYEVQQAPAADTAPLLRRVPLNLAEAHVEMPPDVVQDLVPSRVVTLLGAHGGAGKSLLKLVLGLHVACGRPWAGLPTRQCRVLDVTLEDTGDVERVRMRRVAATYGLPLAEIERNFEILDGTESGAALATEIGQDGVRRLLPLAAFEELRSAAPGFGLILIDGASDAYDADENSRRQVRAFMRGMLTRLAVEVSAGVLLLVHIDKALARSGGGGESYSGSSAWHNSARSRLALVEASGRLELRQEKRQFGKPADPIPLQWSGDGVLMPVGGDSGSRLAAAAITADADAAALLVVIADAEAKGIMVPVGRTGPATTWHCLSTLPGFPDALREKSARLRFLAGLDLLQARGRIVRETYKDHRRHHKERWSTRAGTGADAPVDAPEGARHTSPHTPLPEPAQGRRCADSGVAPESGTRANPRKPEQLGCSAADYVAAREGA